MHALDLPPLRSQPSYESLSDVLTSLSPEKATFLSPIAPPLDAGTINWLTRLIGADLTHLPASQAETLTASASNILAAQCGRTAMSAMTRTFAIPRSAVPGDEISITIHEPALTADSLGLKTWSTSFLFSRILHEILPPYLPSQDSPLRVLELGSGTGLTGLALAYLFPSMRVTLTDYLPEILENLRHNVELNPHMTASQVEVAWLDWTEAAASPVYGETYDLVVTTDFMYAHNHADQVADLLSHFTRRQSGLALAAYPLRSSNLDFRKDFGDRMAADEGWKQADTGTVTGWDDWGGPEGVESRWHIYRRI